MKFEISIIIPNYNGANLLNENVPELIKNINSNTYSDNYHVSEIIIVDDGSTDNSKEVITQLINKFSHNIKIIGCYRNANYGFSSTVNFGVTQAKGKLVALLNTDVCPESNFLDSAISHFNEENVFAVGFLDQSIENGKSVERGCGTGFWKNGLLMHTKEEDYKKETFWVSGGSSIYRKQIWDKLKGMDELYNPFYWEDIDLSYRARKAGYSIIFEPKSIVKHMHSRGSIVEHFSSRDIEKIAFRNQILFVWLNITSPKLLINHFIWIFPILLEAIIDGKRYYLESFISLLKIIPQVLKQRKERLKYFIKSDEELFN